MVRLIIRCVLYCGKYGICKYSGTHCCLENSDLAVLDTQHAFLGGLWEDTV